MSVNPIESVPAAQIVAKAPEHIGRGWYCLGIENDFRDGRPHGVEAFETKLVVFATSQGELVVLDGFCPHMGASLSEGAIKGDSIACPFHDWRWGASGRCTAVPYAKRMPARARIRKWDTQVKNGMLFVWYDRERLPPREEDMYIGEIPDFETEFSPWDHSVHEIEISSRELVDNLVDVAHFFYVHGEGVGAAIPFFGNRFMGKEAWQFVEATTPPGTYDPMQPGVSADLIEVHRSETAYFGPGYLQSRLLTRMGDDMFENYLLLCQVPKTPNSFTLHIFISNRNHPELSVEQNCERHERIAKIERDSTLQDIRIWETKTRIDNPLLCDTDGPVYQLRRWYEQFFVGRDEATSEMTDVFEQITDTTHAMIVWDEQAREKLENLGRQGLKIDVAEMFGKDFA